MKTLAWAAILIGAFIVSGCASNEVKYVTITTVKDVLVEPPREFYTPVTTIKPPAPKLYVQADWEAKEKMLFEHIDRLNIQLRLLKVDRTNLQKWLTDTRALYTNKESP